MVQGPGDDPSNESEAAARFIYLNKTCFNGLYRVNRQGRFNVPMGSYLFPSVFSRENILSASSALGPVSLSVRDFREIRPGAGDLVYADPPYHGTFSQYSALGFSKDDQVGLRDSALSWAGLGASVVVSSSDTPFVRDIYRSPSFCLHSVRGSRQINSDPAGRGSVPELVIVAGPARRSGL